MIAGCAFLGSRFRVPVDVETCSQYEDRTLPNRWDMEKIAWTLGTDTRGRVLGFRPPNKDKNRDDHD